MSATAACPKCDPCNPELDEDGRPYACYFCGDSGSVPKGQADAYWRDQTDAYEYRGMRPVIGGKHLVWRRLRSAYSEDDCDAGVIEVDLLPAEVMRAARAATYRATHVSYGYSDGIDDDLPF